MDAYSIPANTCSLSPGALRAPGTSLVQDESSTAFGASRPQGGPWPYGSRSLAPCRARSQAEPAFFCRYRTTPSRQPPAGQHPRPRSTCSVAGDTQAPSRPRPCPSSILSQALAETGFRLKNSQSSSNPESFISPSYYPSHASQKLTLELKSQLRAFVPLHCPFCEAAQPLSSLGKRARRCNKIEGVAHLG